MSRLLQLIREHTKIFGQEVVFDGLILYLPFDLAEKQMLLKGVNPHSGVTVQIKVKRTCVLPPGDPQCITVFNLVNRK